MKREHRHVFSCIITERRAKQKIERTEMNTNREMVRQKIESSRPVYPPGVLVGLDDFLELGLWTDG